MSAETLLATKKGWTAALRNCGHWPTSAAEVVYQAAAGLAEREVDRAITTWQRWRRRFDPDPDRLEVGSGRTNALLRHGGAGRA